MKYTVTQVGRRWFKVKAEVSTFRNGCESIAVVVDVEATLHFTSPHSKYYWTLNGLGMMKYREDIIDELNEYFCPNSEPF